MVYVAHIALLDINYFECSYIAPILFEQKLHTVVESCVRFFFFDRLSFNNQFLQIE
jgi:hypothetical protein